MALDMFLKFSGPNAGPLLGESTDVAHVNEIDVLAWSWGVASAGGAPGRQDLNFTKYVDRASIGLLQSCCSGMAIGSALLTIRRTGATPVEKIKLQITDVVITSLSTGGSGGEDRLTENVSIGFGKLKIAYVYEPTGTPTQSRSGGWDFANNVKI